MAEDPSGDDDRGRARGRGAGDEGRSGGFRRGGSGSGGGVLLGTIEDLGEGCRL